MIHSRILHCGPIEKFYRLNQSRIFTFLVIPEFLHFVPFPKNTLWNFPEFLSSRPYQIFTFWTIPGLKFSGPIQNFSLSNYLGIYTFWTVPEFLHSGPLKNCTFWTNQECLNSTLFQNSFVLNHFRISLF